MFRFLARILDIILTLVLLLLCPVIFLLLTIGSRLAMAFSRRGHPVLLTISSGSYEAGKIRNVGKIYDASALGGYFSELCYVCYLADRPGHFEHNKSIHIWDFRFLPADFFKRHGFVFLFFVLQELALINFLLKLIHREKVTVIQANDPYIQGFNSLLISWMTGVPFAVKVMCDYDHYFEHFGRLAFPVLKYRALEKWIERAVYRGADAVKAWNENYRRYSIESGSPPEKTFVVPTVTDEAFFREEMAIPRLDAPFSVDQHPILIYLGRLAWDKYALDLVESMVEVKRKFPSAKLVILGGGDLREEFLAKSQQLGVMENMHLPGPQPVEQICAWARVAKVMLATHGGFSLIEMGAQGVPIVAYDYEWHREMVIPGQTGFLVPFRDAAALGQAAVKILSDPKLGAEMKQSIRQLAFRNHHPEVVRKKTIEFFEKIR